ncbi:PAS domain-containing protein [Gluconobacter oxydans]|uniref:PAS domain-containing protein n=1 Tax=Gluconobacter oxydans TaxID=442 RepID=UPI0039EAE962
MLHINLMRHSLEDRRINGEIHRTLPSQDPFAAAMRASRMPMLITNPRYPDNPIVFVNDAFLKLTGYERHEILGRNCRFLQGPGTNLNDIERLRLAIERKDPIEIDLLNYRKDGTVFWNRLLVSPVFQRGVLAFFFASQLDVTRERTAGFTPEQDATEKQMQQRIAELTASEERHNFTLRAGSLGTWTLEFPKRRLVASAICKVNFGYNPADSFTYEDLFERIHPDDRFHWQSQVEQALREDGDLHVEYRIIRPNGEQRWMEVRGETRFDSEGRPLLMSGISSDITDRREAEAYRDLMVQEMGHRHQNPLQPFNPLFITLCEPMTPMQTFEM